MLRIIEDSKTIDTCQGALRAAINKLTTEKKRHVVGFPSGSMEALVYYVHKFGFWMTFEEISNRYWNVCGIGYPFGVHAPAPHVEINVPYSGIDRSVAGAFLEDEAGVRYLGHTGKVGGGTKGVGRANFLQYYPAWSIVESGDKPWQMYIISRLDAPDLAGKIADFTRESAEFRAKIKAGKKPVPKSPPIVPPTFHQEFEGQKSYTTADQVLADCKHGKVVKGLRNQLAAHGIPAWNTGSRDLYVAKDGQTMCALFEVKTSADTTSTYTALGQLLFHGGAGVAEHLVAVFPEEADATIVTRVTNLGIAVVTYGWSADGNPVFQGLEHVAESIKAT